MVAGELLVKTLRRMHADVINGVATGGTATEIQDTSLASKYPLNKFKGWIAVIKKTSNAASPQSRWAIVSASTAAGVITISSVTDVVESGDEYVLCKPIIPLYEMTELMKDGLQQLGKLNAWDRSLTTTTQTKRYTLPIAMKGSPLRSIRLEDEQYNQIDTPNYYVEPNAGGVAPTLVFYTDPLDGYTIAINYIGLHPEITAYSTYISEDIHPDLAVASCFERAMFWKCQPKNKKIDVQNWNTAIALLEKAKQQFPIHIPPVEENNVPLSMYNGTPS